MSQPNDGGPLKPEEKVAVFDRFNEAYNAWLESYWGNGKPVEVFYAGYKAGYGHAKDAVM